jgi:hypothetical protein
MALPRHHLTLCVAHVPHLDRHVTAAGGQPRSVEVPGHLVMQKGGWLLSERE